MTGKAVLTPGKFRLAWRLAVLATAIIVLLWLPIEDPNACAVQVIAAIICSLVSIMYIYVIRQRIASRSAGLYRRLVPIVTVGLLAGLSVLPTVILLMIFKSGLHGHGTFEYTFAQMQDTLSSWWIWGLTGMILASASGFLPRKND